MVDFTIELRRSPEITEDECRRRLGLAYQILLESDRRKTAERDELGDPDRSAASEAPASEPSGDNEKDAPYTSNSKYTGKIGIRNSGTSGISQWKCTNVRPRKPCEHDNWGRVSFEEGGEDDDVCQ